MLWKSFWSEEEIIERSNQYTLHSSAQFTLVRLPRLEEWRIKQCKCQFCATLPWTAGRRKSTDTVERYGYGYGWWLGSLLGRFIQADFCTTKRPFVIGIISNCLFFLFSESRHQPFESWEFFPSKSGRQDCKFGAWGDWKKPTTCHWSPIQGGAWRILEDHPS